jgi:uncharacterized FlaG/YvyC family protein
MFEFFANIFLYIAYCVLILAILVHVVSYVFPLGTYKFPVQIVSLILILLGGYYVADHHGYERRVAEDQAEIIRLNEEARAKEAELTAKIDKANGALRKAKNDIQSKVASLNARVDTGELRLPSSCPVQADSSAPDGNRTDASESERQTVKALIQIAADGDIAINNLNSCIAQYNEVMKTVNEGVK